MVPPHGRAAAKGLQPRAAPQGHDHTRAIFVIFFIFLTCSGRKSTKRPLATVQFRRKSRFARLAATASRANENASRANEKITNIKFK